MFVRCHYPMAVSRAEQLGRVWSFIAATGGERQMPTEEMTTEAPEQESEPMVEMCCDGSGRTAEEHRAESPDHKCCIDK